MISCINRFGKSFFHLLILLIFSSKWFCECVRLENYEILAEDQIVEKSEIQNKDELCRINKIGESCSGEILKLNESLQLGIVLNIKTELTVVDLEFNKNNNATISDSDSISKSSSHSLTNFPPKSLRNSQRDEGGNSVNMKPPSEIYHVDDNEEEKKEEKENDRVEKEEEKEEEKEDDKVEKEKNKEEEEQEEEMKVNEIKGTNYSTGNITSNATISSDIENLINEGIKLEKHSVNLESTQARYSKQEVNKTKNNIFLNNITDDFFEISNSTLLNNTNNNNSTIGNITQFDHLNTGKNYINSTNLNITSNNTNSTTNIKPDVINQINSTNDLKNWTIETGHGKQTLKFKNNKSEDSFENEIKESNNSQKQVDMENNTNINTKYQNKYKRHHILIDDHEKEIILGLKNNNSTIEKVTKNETKEISFDLDNYTIMYNITSSQGAQRYLLILSNDEIILVNTILDDIAPHIGHNSNTDKLPLFMEATLNGINKAINLNQKTTKIHSSIKKHSNNQKENIGKNEAIHRKKTNSFVGTISKFKIPIELFPLNKKPIIIDIDLVQNNISFYAYIRLETTSNGQNEILRLSTTLAVSSLGVDDITNINVLIKDNNKTNVSPSLFTLKKENNQSNDEKYHNSDDNNNMSPKYEISKHPIQKSFWKKILKSYTN